MITKTQIKRARKAAGLSQEGAARAIGISTAMWQSCELGRRKMRPELFAAFKAAVMREKAERCSLIY